MIRSTGVLSSQAEAYHLVTRYAWADFPVREPSRLKMKYWQILMILAVMKAVSVASAVEPAARVVEPLWPGIPRGSQFTAEGDNPELIITRVDAAEPTAAVVILPGGGYGGHAIDHEGYQFADWFAELGITSAICTYRLRGKGNDGRGYGHPIPMWDAQRAIRTLRAQASNWNIDPSRIGVIGFSAGGHLASTVSTHFAAIENDSDDPANRVSSRPDFSILCYPVIAFGQPHTHRGSQINLIGEQADAGLIDSLSNDRQVSQRTPPTFLFHTAEDKAVPVQNSIDYFLACQRNGVPTELHVFAEGRHGVGLAKGVAGADQWPPLCAAWLRRIGVLNGDR